ncbi:hypothetical protein EDD15DRAFT_2364712 [Pisolithus albus]|nr:hypothetical protein EDD15DRAFT_2364712 [Pisolithus albus]
MQMDDVSLRDANPSNNQGKNPCPLQLTPRFYFPPIPGSHPDPPYPLGDHSATTTVFVTPNISDSAWQFSDNTVRPMSFTDLLESPLYDYGGHTEIETICLPQPTVNSTIYPNQSLTNPGGATTAPDEQLSVPITTCKGGTDSWETTTVSPPTEGLRDVTVAVAGCRVDSTREVSTQDRLSEPSTMAGDALQVPSTEAMGGTRAAPARDTHLSGLSTGAEEPPQVLNDASWRARNPGKPVIPPRNSEKLDAAQRAARKAAAELRRVKQQAITDAVAELLEEQETRINEIAKAHSILPEKVRLLITGETHYRKRREESLANALVRIKARQVNADLPCGQKFQLKELQEMVANDPHLQNLDEETKQKYLGELKESRSRKAIGVRSTNTAASRDIQATLKKIYVELQALAYRTGIYACLFVTRGHVYDMHAATWFGTDNIMDFWEDRMKLSPDYIIKQLELWACNEEKNIEAHDSLENMQKQAKNGLDSGFSSITKHLHQEKAVRLRFGNFEQIKYKFGIGYEGWPEGVPFSSPYKIQTIDEIRCLQDVIRDNTFRWVKMTATQHHEYRKQVDERHKAKRKALNDENVPQASKKARRGRAQTTPKSREIITTSDEESDGAECI